MTRKHLAVLLLVLLPLIPLALFAWEWLYGSCESDCWDRTLGFLAFLAVLLAPGWLVAGLLLLTRTRFTEWLAAALCGLYAAYVYGLGFIGGDLAAAMLLGAAAAVHAYVWAGQRYPRRLPL